MQLVELLGLHTPHVMNKMPLLRPAELLSWTHDQHKAVL